MNKKEHEKLKELLVAKFVEALNNDWRELHYKERIGDRYRYFLGEFKLTKEIYNSGYGGWGRYLKYKSLECFLRYPEVEDIAVLCNEVIAKTKLDTNSKDIQELKELYKK